jgi:integrase
VPVKGAANVKRRIKIVPATLAELEVMTRAMPERLQLMVVMAAWCQLRPGELIELRRSDIDLLRGKVTIAWGATRTKGEWHVGGPKTNAGNRELAIPPHLLPVVAVHLDAHVGPGPEARLFCGAKSGYLSPSSLYDHWYPARATAGRPDLRFYDLRHTGATLSAATGATMAELMHRLGHATSHAAMMYQHATEDRDAALAQALSGFYEAQVVELRALVLHR